MQKRNRYISGAKGVSLIAIVLIHLIDWSNTSLNFAGILAKEFLYAGVLIFVLTTGSVIVLAYGDRPSLFSTTKRLLSRGALLLLYYYAYSMLKLLVFNFATQPFYAQFAGALTILNILAFRVFAVPLTILITFAFLLALSPLFILIHARTKHPKTIFAFLIAALLLINYATALPALSNPPTHFLYANGFVLFPLALWLVPFLLGILLAEMGFEKQKMPLLLGSGLVVLLYVLWNATHHLSLLPSHFEFPLGPYFIASGLFVLALLLYALTFLERVRTPWIQKALGIVQFLGDRSLDLYLLHWIVIDLTIWFFAPHVAAIWLTVPLFFITYLIKNFAPTKWQGLER